MAFDTIMVFHDRFKHHILPDQVHILNVSFLVPELRREYGGCAGNIAYNLKLLGEDPLILATVGRDFAPYAQWLSTWGISARGILELEDCYTAQAFITTDLDDNQITAFHPGAMSLSDQISIPPEASIEIGLVSPDGKNGMMAHAQQLAERGIPFILDPGQAMPLFNGDELQSLIEKANWLTLNDYEAQLMCQRTQLSLEKLAKSVAALVVTHGGQGSRIYAGERVIEIPPVRASETRDPTGCGDAYRAGLVHGLLQGYDWEVSGRIASLMGAIKIEHFGTQNHGFSRNDFHMRYKESFGFKIA